MNAPDYEPIKRAFIKWDGVMLSNAEATGFVSALAECGVRLVPLEPTSDMQAAVDEHVLSEEDMYTQMVLASPQRPPPLRKKRTESPDDPQQDQPK